jgi:hypothetical protein
MMVKKWTFPGLSDSHAARSARYTAQRPGLQQSAAPIHRSFSRTLSVPLQNNRLTEWHIPTTFMIKRMRPLDECEAAAAIFMSVTERSTDPHQYRILLAFSRHMAAEDVFNGFKDSCRRGFRLGGGGKRKAHRCYEGSCRNRDWDQQQTVSE